MPKYTNSRHTRGAQFVEIDGVSYRKTGNYKLLTDVPVVDDSTVKLLYVDSCSAAEFGEQQLSDGGMISIPEDQTTFQLKFDGVAGESGMIELQDAGGSPCWVTVSVNPTGNLVWSDTTGSSFEFTTIGQVYNYTDCNSNTYDVVYAGTGSWIITVKKTGNSSSSSGGGGGGSTSTPQTWNYILGLDETAGSWRYVFEGDLPTATAGYNLPTTITVGDTINFEVYNEGESAGSYLRISQDYVAGVDRMSDGDWMPPVPYDPTDLTDTYDTRAEFATYGLASYDPTLVGVLTSGNQMSPGGQVMQHIYFKPLLSGTYTIQNSIETGATATITVVDPAGSTTTYTPNEYSISTSATSNGVDFTNYMRIEGGSYVPVTGTVFGQNGTVPLTAGDKITFALNENTTTFQIVSSDCSTAYDPTHQLTQGDHADYTYTVTPNTDTMVEITFKTAGTWYYRDTRYPMIACGKIEVVAS